MNQINRLASIVIGCKHGEVLALVGEFGQELAADVGRVYSTDCRSETGETCGIQGLDEAGHVGRVLGLSICHGSGERQEERREDEDHALDGGR